MDNPEFTISLKENNYWCMDRLHFHDSIEFLFPLSGGGQCFINDRVFSMHKNSLFVFDSAVLHRTINNDPNQNFKRYMFQVTPASLEAASMTNTDFRGSIRLSSPCLNLTKQDSEKLLHLFQRLEHAQVEHFGDDVQRYILFLELMLHLCHCLEVADAEESITNQDWKRILPLLEFLNGNYMEPISLDMLAKRFAFSKYHLCHMFKNVTGSSIKEYIIQKRIILAQKLLRQNLSVQEVGERSGFQTNSHFIRTFKEYTGTSPRKYAQQYGTVDQMSYFEMNPQDCIDVLQTK